MKQRLLINLEKKHVILLHHTSAQGGGTKSLIDIAIMLKDEYKVTVCIPSGSKETIELANRYLIDCYEIKTRIPTLNVFSGSAGVFSGSFVKGILGFLYIDSCVNELLSLNPDVVILNSLVTSIIARRIPKNIKVICFIRETFEKSIFDKYIKNTFEHYIDGVAYIAEHEKNYLQIKLPKQVVIPDTLEPSSIRILDQNEAIKSLGLRENNYHILFMGGGSRLKGFDIVLESVKYLSCDFRVLIVGNINYELYSISNMLKHFYNFKYLTYLIRTRRLLKTLNNDCRLVLMGYQTDISKLMSACDVVVFPSLKPHQPRPCIEAGMYHKPVVLSDFEATKEYFINKYNALTFEPCSGKDLAKKLYMLKSDSDIRKMIGENNYLMSSKMHNYDEIQKKTNSFINEVIRN